ncbi:MAG: DHHW family protein [Clostridium sp.]
MTRIYKISMIAIFIIPLILFSALFFITRSRDFSESENRVLQTMPEFSTYSLFQGRYTKKFETYISDQFPFRDGFVSGKTSLDKLLLKKEGNGVYFGDDEFLFQKINVPSKEVLDRVINSIKTMSKREGYKVSTIIVPSSSVIYEEMLPMYVNSHNEEKALDYIKNSLEGSVNYIDLIGPMMSSKAERLYYKTDHHWTSEGSYLAYRQFALSSGIKPHSPEEYNIKVGTRDFLGSLYSKVLDNRSDKDVIKLYYFKNRIKDYTVEINGKTYDNIYFMNRLNEKDKYKVFLNDNYPYIKVNGNPKATEDLVVIKDSYANSLIPFLAEHYKTIHVIDPRYYNTGMDKLIEKINCKNLIYVMGLEGSEALR